MILNIIVDDQRIPIEVPEYLFTEAISFFDKMDADMDAGWQMSRNWVDCPNDLQRCQIAADKILTAFHNEKQELATMMAAYILQKIPRVASVEIDTTGDMTQTVVNLQS
jgi:hypothetical protein